MSITAHTARQCNNLLSLLPDDDYQALQPYLELVKLPVKKVIFERDKPMPYIYFPCNCVLSFLTHMEDGTAIEVGTVGNEGFSGIDVLIGADLASETCICQIPGNSFRIRTAVFREMVIDDTPIRTITQRHLQAYFRQMSQSVACNRLHTNEARFARWMLITHDRVQGNEFYMTQEFMAIMLGMHRPSISLIAGAFQEAGMIRYQRGRMTIVDRAQLEDICCECYGIVAKQFQRVLGHHRG